MEGLCNTYWEKGNAYEILVLESEEKRILGTCKCN
jgi:hypothetical protein